MNDLISIIIPAYKASKTIRRCVESLINQTYSNIEILIIDDGSPDDTGILCDELAKQDGRIHVYHKENGGVSTARNFGFLHAAGQYLLCVDSDDYVDKDYVLSFIEARKKYPEARHIWCGLEMLTASTAESTIFISNSNKKYTVSDRKDILDITRQLLGLSPFGKLYEREYLLTENIFMDENLSLGEDALFNYEYLDKSADSSIVIINKPLYKYIRNENGSLDTRYYPNLFEFYKSYYEKIETYLKKWNISETSWSDFYEAKFYAYEKAFRNNMRKENDMPWIRKVSWNTSLMKGVEFRDTFSRFTGTLHPLYRWAFSTKCYIIVILIEKLISLKRR